MRTSVLESPVLKLGFSKCLPVYSSGEKNTRLISDKLINNKSFRSLYEHKEEIRKQILIISTVFGQNSQKSVLFIHKERL